LSIHKADLHIHTLLSPCADLEMTPHNIVKKAIEEGLTIIGITDHNTTRQVALVKQLAERQGLFVMQGVEVNTKEEVHCLAFFPSEVELSQFQDYLDKYLPNIPNKPELFGDQVVINEEEEIIFEESRLLFSALKQSIEQVEQEVHRLGGIFIPAHVNKRQYGVFSQLGFIPEQLKCDALEIFHKNEMPKSMPDNVTLLSNSDAHFLADIGVHSNDLELEELSFAAIKEVISR
jgi:PHP family Zn ribbon phosphoesterase